MNPDDDLNLDKYLLITKHCEFCGKPFDVIKGSLEDQKRKYCRNQGKCKYKAYIKRDRERSLNTKLREHIHEIRAMHGSGGVPSPDEEEIKQLEQEVDPARLAEIEANYEKLRREKYGVSEDPDAEIKRLMDEL